MATPFLLSRANQLSATEAAYLAAFIDADGSVLCLHQRQRGRMFHRPGLAASQKDQAILQWFQTLTGEGHIYLKPANLGEPNYVWQVFSLNSVLDLLAQIAPYLRIKHNRAAALLNGLCPITLRQRDHGIERVDADAGTGQEVGNG